MVGVHDQHRTGAAPIRSIDQHPAFPRFLDQTLDRRRVWADDRDHTPCIDQIAKADVDEDSYEEISQIALYL